MNRKRKLLPLLLALVLVLSLAGTASAAGSDTASSYIRQMINYYRCYQDKAATDIAHLSEQLAKVDTAQAAAWENIMDYWKWTNSQMEINTGVLPDGLPEDDSLCIVVLGYQLKSSGSMRSELIGRLQVALASAEKYPNAYILCTGGGTAKYNKNTSEAQQMASWLIRKGIDEDRIIIENKSLSTAQNAQYSCEILRTSYPQVTSLALVTSDYHIRRGSLCFYTQGALSAYSDGGNFYDIVANAAYATGSASESISSQASDIARIAGISLEDMEKPSLCRLSYIAVGGKTTYETGSALAISVTAVYSNGYQKDVTALAEFSGSDLTHTGTQILTVKYAENNYKATAAITITVSDPGASGEEPAPTEMVDMTVVAETEEPPETEATEPVEVSSSSADSAAPLLPFLVLAPLLALCSFAIRKMKKRS